jgi:hypothetical protein
LVSLNALETVGLSLEPKKYQPLIGPFEDPWWRFPMFTDDDNEDEDDN